MANLLHADGLRKYGTLTNLLTAWTFTGGTTLDYFPTGGRSGNGSVGIGVGVGNGMAFVLPANVNSICAAVAVNPMAGCFNPLYEQYKCAFIGVTDTGGRRIEVNSNGGFGVTLKVNDVEVARSGNKKFTSGVWQWVELQITLAGSVMTATVRVAERIVLIYIDPNWSTPAPISRFQSSLGHPGVTDSFYFYVCDYVCTDGGFPGDRICVEEPVNGNTAQADWLPNGVVNPVDALDNTPPSLTQYLNAPTIGNRSNFTFADLPNTAANILGFVLASSVYKSDGGTSGTQAGFITGMGQANGQNVANNTSATWQFDPMNINPATGQPYTVADFNAGEVTIARTA